MPVKQMFKMVVHIFADFVTALPKLLLIVALLILTGASDELTSNSKDAWQCR